jgi:hypothetical protein
MYKSQLIIVWLGGALLRLLRLFWVTLVLSSAMITGEREKERCEQHLKYQINAWIQLRTKDMNTFSPRLYRVV